MSKPVVGQKVYFRKDGDIAIMLVQKVGRLYFYIADKECYPEYMWDKVTLEEWRVGSSYNRGSFQVYVSVQAILDATRKEELKKAIQKSLFEPDPYAQGKVELPLNAWEDIAKLIEPWRER